MAANAIVQERINAAFCEVMKLENLRRLTLLGSALYLPNPTDIDIGALLDPRISLASYVNWLVDKGWAVHGDYFGSGPIWHSFTKEGVNLLVMTDPERLRKFELAMRVCAGLHLTRKRDRIIVCQIIRDGSDPDIAKVVADEMIKKHNQSRS